MSKLFFHFSVEGFSNTYLLGPENGGDAIIIDPGTFDSNLLSLIENNNFYVKSVLITHNHESHTRGLRTLLKIYNAKIYSASKSIMGFPSIRLADGQELDLDGYFIKCLETPGHSGDSLVFQCDKMLFTGDVLAAGQIGETDSAYSHKRLLDEITNKLLTLEDNYYIFPGHGPPTSLNMEKKYNLSFGAIFSQSQ